MLPFSLPSGLPSSPAVTTGGTGGGGSTTVSGPYQARYVIRVRDSGRNLIGEVDQYKHFQTVLRFNNVSTWTLEVDANHPMAGALATPGNGVVVLRSIIAKPTNTIISTAVLISGPIWHFNRKKQGNMLIVAGFDDTALLGMRDGWPVPSAAVAADFASSAYDTRTGAAESVIRAYVDNNAGPSAPAARQAAGLALTADGAHGGTVHGNARFDQLSTKDGLGMLQDLGNVGGVGFKIVQVGTALQLQFYVPTDKSATAIFSDDLGNLVDFDYSLDGPDLDTGGNFVVVGGSGVGTARTFVMGSDSASITRWGRIETFRDARDTNDATTLAERATATLNESKETTNFSAVLAQTEQLIFGIDFNLGDQVTAVVDSIAIIDIIREINITLDTSGGETVTPVIGSANPTAITDALAAFSRKMSRNTTRISKLERAT